MQKGCDKVLNNQRRLNAEEICFPVIGNCNLVKAKN